MLHLKNNLFTLNRHPSSASQLALSPVRNDENDELIQAINDSHEEQWQLDPTPDAKELGEFWSGVSQDLERDPTWFSFAADDDGA